MNILTNHLPTSELQKLDAAHHLHPFTDGDELRDKGVRVIKSAKGSTLTDSDGNEILDAMAGLWCVNVGYGREELAEVAARQMRELPYYNTFFQTTHVPAISLAKRLAELAPHDLNHVFFSNSGSEANDTNLRIVRTYWAELGKESKRVIISRKNSYHGSTVAASSLGGMGYMHKQAGDLVGDIHHIAEPNWWAEGGDSTPEEFGLACAKALEEAILELGEENVAAFIAEPVQGAGGVIIPPETYWPEIQRICDKYDILLIADEVICGFGRTGNWFGCETYNIKPDMMTVAKGLSSGYAPISASIVNDRVASVINGTDFAHGYTYSGHPVACAVALENLRLLDEEGIVERATKEVAPYLAERWQTLADHPLVGEACIVGMMGSIALTPDKSTRAKFASETGTIGLMCRENCFANNLVMRHVGDRMVISPPLVFTRDDVDLLIERATIALDQTLEQAKREGKMESA